jgi:integrase
LAVASDEVDEGATLKEYIEARLTRREIGHEVRDPQSDWGRFREHIEGDAIGAITVTRVKRRHLLPFVRRLKSKGLAAQTIRNVLHIISGALGEAVDDELLEANPALRLRVAPDKRTKETWLYLMPAEQVRLLQAAPDELSRCIVQTAMGTGLRAGELCAVRLADMFVGDSPRIVVRYGGAPAEPTKWGRIREVPLFGMALDAVKQTKALRLSPNPAGLLFPAPRGGFRPEEHLISWKIWKGGTFNEKTGTGKRTRRTYEGMVSKAALRPNFRWHDLRHTCGTSLVSGWWGRRWALEEVQELLGHQDIRTTQRYAKLAADALNRAARDTGGIDPELIRPVLSEDA